MRKRYRSNWGRWLDHPEDGLPIPQEGDNVLPGEEVIDMTDLTKEQQEEIKAAEEETAETMKGMEEERERARVEENIRRERAGLPSVEEEAEEAEKLAKAQEKAEKAESKEEK